MLDWLIVGGGVHGVVLATALLDRAGTARSRLLIIDPNRELLSAWKKRTHACGMEFLRSPSAHGLEPDFGSLPRWAGRTGWDRRRHTIPPYARPSLTMFNAYADHVVADRNLSEIHRVDTVVRLEEDCRGWKVLTSTGTEELARRVILATGAGTTPRIPSWARDLPNTSHVYDRKFDRLDLSRARRPVVVGGGVAAVQLALWCARRSEAPVHLLSRAPLRIAQFDSDPCYIGPACMQPFLSEPHWSKRRRMLAAARNPGSVPRDAAEELRKQIEAGRIVHCVDDITGASITGTAYADAESREARAVRGVPGGTEGRDEDRKYWEITLSTSNNRSLRADFVALATGFDSRPASDAGPEGFLGPLISGVRGGPPTHLGYPVLRPDLSWLRGLYVTGRPAELQLGPSAPNIVGAHNGAKRIISSLRGMTRMVPSTWQNY